MHALSLKKCLHNWTSLILGFTTDEKIQDKQSHFFPHFRDGQNTSKYCIINSASFRTKTPLWFGSLETPGMSFDIFFNMSNALGTCIYFIKISRFLVRNVSSKWCYFCVIRRLPNFLRNRQCMCSLVFFRIPTMVNQLTVLENIFWYCNHCFLKCLNQNIFFLSHSIFYVVYMCGVITCMCLHLGPSHSKE